MTPARSTTPPQSLAAAQPGQRLRVQRILFGGLRTLCAERGLSEGDVVQRVASDDGDLRLTTSHGGMAALRREWAPFIQVALVEEESRTTAATHGGRFELG